MTIRTPRGMAADVTLKGPRKAVFAKPARGTSVGVRRQLPAGRYRVRPQAVVFHGALYQSASSQIVTVAARRPVRITVRFSKVASASSLHATRISTTSISLAWSAPRGGAAFALRRTAGRQPALSRRAGTAVHAVGRTAVDTRLTAGKQYTYALFTRLHGRWVGPITLLAGTSAAAASKTASFVTAPGTLLATPAQVHAATATGAGVRVALSPSVTTPVIGSAVVLPQSASLPGGYIGLVSSISGDGSTVALQPAGLSAAFSYYNITIPHFTSAATKLIPTVVPRASGARPSAAEASCNVTSSGTITFSPSLRLGGSFHATINTTSFLHAPTGASLAMELTATVTGAMSVETSAGVKCELSYPKVVKTFAADPVPISVVFTPSAEISVEDAVEESNLGATVTGGVQFSGTLGATNGARFSGSDILAAQPLTPEVSANGKVGVKLGGEVAVGPGVTDEDAGVVAGLSGELDPLDASFGPQFPADANACLKTSVDLLLQFGLTAKAWLEGWSIDRKITFSALKAHLDYPGSPWYFPSKCDESPPLTVSGGTLPAGQVSTLYDHTLSAAGGTEPYEWTVVDGSLPPGLSLSDEGELSGTPISAGTSQFVAQVTDEDGKTAIGTFSLTVNPVETAPDAITEYDVSPDLGCTMLAAGDADGEFYGGDACGTVIAVGGQLYGPADIPAGGNLTGAGNYTGWDPTSQATSGSGTSADPFVTTTGAAADGSPITVSQTDTYAAGGSTVNTATTLTNSSGSPVQVMLYHGFDCFPADSDTGTGTSSGGSVSCVSDNVTSDGARTLRLSPGTGGSTFVEEVYSDLWAGIATGNPFPNTVRADDHDTAEGLAWPVTVPAAGSVTVQYSTDLLLTQQ
jgi:hypothetical protein